MARARQNQEIEAEETTAAFTLSDLFDFDFDGIRGIRAYDVGQGNANGIVDLDGDIILYNDYGGLGDNCPADIGQRLNVELCDGDGDHIGYAAIVLSHWDLDHYSTARLVADARQRSRWLAPRQRVGAQAVSFANLLTEVGDDAAANLRLWGRDHRVCEWNMGNDTYVQIERCTGADPTGPESEEERNHTGLTMTLIRKEAAEDDHDADTDMMDGDADTDDVEITEAVHHAIILPGDAPYRYISTLADGVRTNGMRCHALVAYHHGAHTHWNPGCSEPVQWLADHCSDDPKVVFSYGANNIYGHPHPGNYTDNGWPEDTHLETPDLSDVDGDEAFFSIDL